MKTQKRRQPMKKQSPKKRIKNFNEVALGYTHLQAIAEAQRCLGCKKKPCVEGCPVEIDIPAFIHLIAEGDFNSAIKKMKEKNNLPAICGRVCPQETQCEILCVLGKKGEPEAIGRLERFVADWEAENFNPAFSKIKTAQKNKGRVAVVGSGPSGLTCAADLARMGYLVKIFESLHETGGVLRYGIPEFRLPKRVVNREVEYVKSLGVEIVTNVLVGKSITIEELFKEGFQAIFIGTGAGLPMFLGVPGENLNGIYSANEFLTRVNLGKAYLFPEYDTPVNIGEKVAVIGAGNVSMDSARSALRLGVKESSIVYRRSEVEMPARKEEIENAREEGVVFHLLTNPLEFIGDENGWVKKMKCIRNRLGEPDESGRRRPVPIPGSEFIMDIDTVVIAIGQSPNPLIPQSLPGLKLGRRGNIQVDEETGKTDIEGIFAGGDIASGAATVIAAMGAGKSAAHAIDKYISKKD
ncbi:MAG: NADPH-dependent glutamate synthase [Candidatus Aerophobetes bacterium]|nr:NADPH-dependent glutamate synthase [Candidatus Aerophobetes bacterium]